MPSQEDQDLSWFDRFASRASDLVSRAPFFFMCVLLVVIWFPTLFLMPIDMSQLIINTATTIITFLLVALLENTSKRGNDAIHQKLNGMAKFNLAMCEGLAELLRKHESEQAVEDLHKAAEEVRAAIGLEERESS